MTPTVGRVWNAGMMSSVRQDWATPQALFDRLDAEFHFTLDVCATLENAKCRHFLEFGALDRHWIPLIDGAVWCNPPYGRRIGDWIRHAFAEVESRWCKTVVMLLPARTDTAWFHDYCMKGEIRFLRNRLYFTADKTSRAPFPSMIVIFRPNPSGLTTEGALR